MSVPDLLLKSAPKIKPRPAAPNNAAKAPEPRKNESSSFADVYAKERQAKAAQRSDDAAKAESRESVAEEAAPADPAAEEPVLADSGNALPSELQPDPVVEDPALLLSLLGQAPVVDVDPAATLTEEGMLPTQPATLTSSGPASLTEASFDPEIDALNQLPAVQMALEQGAKARAAEALAKEGSGESAKQTTLTTGQGFASAMAAMGAQKTSDVANVVEEPALELSAVGLEALKESSVDSAPENFVSKLSALSQAVNQQVTQTPRVPLAGQPVPMQQAGWSEAVVDRVMLMSSQNLKSAEIQLDPQELGRLEVRISVNQDQTQVTFASAHAGVREALDSQMHRLRELFTQQGMNLADVNVSDQSLNRGWQGQEGDSGKGQRNGGGEGLAQLEDDSLGPLTEMRSSISGGRGMVDFYA
ncbi:MAG: flagellar hook-length control protein FliK [Gammaproteobacteria bacterium]|nr:flagellar hook-length control protein FliK [Gammaproteobacteria bacterium]